MAKDFIAETDRMINIFLECPEDDPTRENLKGRLAILKAWHLDLLKKRDIKAILPNTTIIWDEALEHGISSLITRIEEVLNG